MHRGSLRALFAIISCGAMPATAAGAKFDCDTAAKRFSVVSLPIAGQHLRVSGLVSSKLIRNDEQWAPKLSVYVSGAQQLGGFSISKQPDQPWSVALKYFGKETAPVAALGRLDAVAFTLDVNASTGAIGLTLGSAQYHENVTPFRVDQLTLSCSTGNFLFDQVSWEVLSS